jgi:hypothetical protein
MDGLHARNWREIRLSTSKKPQKADSGSGIAIESLPLLHPPKWTFRDQRIAQLIDAYKDMGYTMVI